ncbi:E3 ubiquitin-protein ligase TRIM9-like isoform X1 [Artemia franciscana]|uniref:E3 ubiquitin-protein ligase TRIM9-like isoform X1 n=1 Tax=Artemia franciscana TaxID=6661 RepID=UPI0032D9EF2E
MEEEIKCAVCKQFFTNPVLLPCYHAICLGCAIQHQQTVQNLEASDSIDNVDADKLSVLSETDSGVVCSSRPCSYIGSLGYQAQSPPSNSLCFSLPCPVCKKATFFDEQGAKNLPSFNLMKRIVEKYCESRDIGSKCELCESVARDATIFCDQCQVFYCDACKVKCHPMRGPLLKHSLISPHQGRILLKNRQAQKAKSCESGRCFDHPNELLSHYCLLCRYPLCGFCVEEQRHGSHDIQPLSSICKASKTELSQSLQQLSEKARAVTEFIQRLKAASEKLNASCEEIETAISIQIGAIIEALKAREQELIGFVRQDRDSKVRRLKEQVSTCTGKLQKTTGLMQFCIEALKETDPSTFLQVSTMLVHRVSSLDITWQNEMATLSSRITPTLDLELDSDSVVRSVELLNFSRMKPPSAPFLIQEECVAENNSITVAWLSHPPAFVEGYVLELDDGSGGTFREVYVGKETVCTVDGLHFNSLYQTRVKAFNSCGEGPYSEIIGLHTAEVAWFTYEPVDILPEIKLSEDLLTAMVDSFEHKVILGSLGFSRGVHYWEYKIDKYEGSADPAFGVARIDVSRNMMLGKDDKGWSMYVDHQRSWFMHCNVHADRSDGGITSGSTVGILLDLDRRQLSFYINDEPQGPVAFTDLHGVFYPAISINRNVTVTLHTALDPPATDTDDSGNEEDKNRD